MVCLNSSALLNAKRILIAYSGGLDSSVLLHLICSDEALKTKTKIAIHINHQLSENAKQWQQHCCQVSEQYQIKYISKTVSLDKNSGQSVEKLARDARYSEFEKIMQKGDVLVTAHHQDDQAETLLLQLFRGAGIKGMAAMPVVKAFAKGSLYRPLLNNSRSELEHYANQHKLVWINDESNFDYDFDRNYLRHEVMPLLKQRWSAVINNLARSAEHHADAQQLLNQQAAEDLTIVQVACNQLSIAQLLQLPKANQMNVLRYWIERNHHQLPSECILTQIIQEVALAKIDAKPCVAWQSTEVRRYQNRLYIMSALAPFDSAQIIPWKNQYKIPGLDLQKLSGELTIRFRQGGEQFHPADRQHSQSVKKLMQEWRIPPWLRDRTPLLYCDDELIAIIDISET